MLEVIIERAVAASSSSASSERAQLLAILRQHERMVLDANYNFFFVEPKSIAGKHYAKLWRSDVIVPVDVPYPLYLMSPGNAVNGAGSGAV